mmetsp:Transcript_4625/g.8521  ORF Transcript_4625/g.8521 Transcript_4625/m.8521 type:complete len:96 (-) Transcript_4625:577-864(-)
MRRIQIHHTNCGIQKAIPMDANLLTVDSTNSYVIVTTVVVSTRRRISDRIRLNQAHSALQAMKGLRQTQTGGLEERNARVKWEEKGEIPDELDAP